MASNNLNRILVGIFLVISVLFSYFLNLDLFLFSMLVILISYDILYMKILNIYFPIIFSLISFLSFLFVPYDFFTYLYIFQLIIVISILVFKNTKKILFTISLYLFCFLLFYIVSSDRNLFYIIIFISFFNDTLAYIFGKSLGGPLILPKISPKKTWSGTSISFCLSASFLVYLNFNIFISLIVSLFLFIGDIFFSYMKRFLKLKDFSYLLGDHGGILDRIDSMFFVVIIFQVYLIYLI